MELKHETISKIGLGSVQFGMRYGISNNQGQTPPNEVSLILKMAKINGVRLIDTAFSYGNAEMVLGENDLASFDIVSKFKGNSPLSQLEKTLDSLKVHSLYGYMSHWPMDLLDYPNCWAELQKAKNTGRIKKIGFSLNEPKEFELLKEFKPDIVQVPYNILDRRFENIMKELKQGGCEIHSRSTFLQGLLFLKPNSLPSFFDEAKPIISELQNNTGDLATTLLKFVLAQPFIDKVIMGVNNVDQFESNLHWNLSSNNLEKTEYNISEDILMPWKWPKN